jgi:hypothetical protein
MTKSVPDVVAKAELPGTLTADVDVAFEVVEEVFRVVVDVVGAALDVVDIGGTTLEVVGVAEPAPGIH